MSRLYHTAIGISQQLIRKSSKRVFRSVLMKKCQEQQQFGWMHNVLNMLSNYNSTNWSDLLFPPHQHQLQLICCDGYDVHPNWEDELLPHDIMGNNNTTTSIDDLSPSSSSIWLMAVPKQKISHMKKRMKTTLRTRIPMKKNIITDPRTGELTLKHHLPWNWRKYLPFALNPPTNNNSGSTASSSSSSYNKNDADGEDFFTTASSTKSPQQ